MSNKKTKEITKNIVHKFIQDIFPSKILLEESSGQTKIGIKENNNLIKDQITINSHPFCRVGYGEIIFNSLTEDGQRRHFSYSKMMKIIRSTEKEDMDLKRLITEEFLCSFYAKLTSNDLEAKLQAIQVVLNIQNNNLAILKENGKILDKGKNSPKAIKNTSNTLQNLEENNDSTNENIQNIVQDNTQKIIQKELYFAQLGIVVGNIKKTMVNHLNKINIINANNNENYNFIKQQQISTSELTQADNVQTTLNSDIENLDQAFINIDDNFIKKLPSLLFKSTLNSNKELLNQASVNKDTDCIKRTPPCILKPIQARNTQTNSKNDTSVVIQLGNLIWQK